MTTTLRGKVALVTGGSRGIGRAIGVRLAQSGAEVALTYRSDQAGAQETLKQIEALGPSAWIFQADVGEFEEVQRMVEKVFEVTGRVDILVNNAGDGGNYWGPIHELPPDLWDRLLRVNLSSAFYVTREVLRHMRSRGIMLQRIINIGSIQGLITNPWGKISSYQAAKAGLAMFTKCLAAELGALGVTVNCVAPGAILTESMLDPSRFPDAASDTEQFSKRIPVQRRGTVWEVANVVAFLASEEASYVTGATIYVDGGMAGYGKFISTSSATRP